jgi:hypothetical protein
MVEQAYCHGHKGLRVVCRGGRLFVLGVRETFQTRTASMMRLLMAVHARHPLPDLDFVLEQTDHPGNGYTQTPTTERCPEMGPVFSFT